jgi:hypothetical protein
MKIIKSFCGCFTVQGAIFSKSAPWPPEARYFTVQMNKRQFEQILKSGEGARVEFKKAVSSSLGREI